MGLYNQHRMLIVDDDALLISSTRIFGISSHGRPMGSEPEVVCEWNLV